MGGSSGGSSSCKEGVSRPAEQRFPAQKQELQSDIAAFHQGATKGLHLDQSLTPNPTKSEFSLAFPLLLLLIGKVKYFETEE